MWEISNRSLVLRLLLNRFRIVRMMRYLRYGNDPNMARISIEQFFSHKICYRDQSGSHCCGSCGSFGDSDANSDGDKGKADGRLNSHNGRGGEMATGS